MVPDKMNRRSMLKATAVGTGALVAGGLLVDKVSAHCGTCMAKKGKKMQNSDFYKNGKFQADKASQAYYDLMKKFDYAIPPVLKTENFWAIDFGLNDFVNVGMAGIFWCNNQEYGFFGHEIFLLPGQMIVEHAHVKTTTGPAKMEAWHVRHGSIYTFGEGKTTVPCPIKLPKSQKQFITAKNGEILKPGEVRPLNRPTAKHFMIAGPEGAIVSEYATFHDNAGLRFTNPGVKF